MSKKDWYFAKQKLIGIIFVTIGIILTCVDTDFLTVSILFAFMGFILIVSKDMVWIDDYWYKHH